jgi:hypothetical protein
MTAGTAMLTVLGSLQCEGTAEVDAPLGVEEALPKSWRIPNAPPPSTASTATTARMR